MKNARTLLAALTASHTFRPLSQHRCYRRYLDLLPERFRRAIAFVTVKNDRLMIALSHPGYKMELHYNQELLKSLLSSLIEQRPECAFMQAKEVVIFTSRYHTPNPAANSEETIPRYRELGRGDFELPEGPEDLKESFRRIRERMRRKKESR